jgi:precorrin-2 dehydrogenase / sirohydrochlorin ferrochelatase
MPIGPAAWSARARPRMIPVIVDPKHVAIALVGRGGAAVRRHDLLFEAGAERLTIFSDCPSPGLVARAGGRLHRRLPEVADLAPVALLWIVGLPLAKAAPLARMARAAGCLVNVEDVIDLCAFHNPAQVRRGDLLLTVSTGGRSPGLAARVRNELARAFGPEWAERLNALAARRCVWRRRGHPLGELARLTNATIDAHGWLKDRQLERARAS